MVLVVLALTSGAAFLHYGYDILFRPRLRDEFTRYGLGTLRSLVGTLELLGGVGVIVGLVYPPVGAMASAGLSLLMLLGITTRLRIHDAPRLMVPAASLAVLNAVLFTLFLRA